MLDKNIDALFRATNDDPLHAFLAHKFPVNEKHIEDVAQVGAAMAVNPVLAALIAGMYPDSRSMLA